MALGNIMCFGSSRGQDDADSRRNAEIDKQLRLDQKKSAREVKLLLLGMTHVQLSQQRPSYLTFPQVLERVESRQC